MILNLVWYSQENVINKTSVTVLIQILIIYIVFISLNAGRALEQTCNCETRRIFDINHAVQILHKLMDNYFISLDKQNEVLCQPLPLVL